MQPRTTIFDSQNERELFLAIHGTWEPDYRLYPQIPFPSLIDLDPQKLDAVQLEFLHKTSVDYVLTTPDGQPVFALEFDGLGHGYSKDGRYVQKVQPRRAPNRQWKLDLKCRVADAANFPFAVVSYDEKTVVDEAANLMIVHGMIGGFLSNRHMGDRMRELMELEADKIADLSPREQYDYIQDYVVIPAELDADTDWNPLVKRPSRSSWRSDRSGAWAERVCHGRTKATCHWRPTRDLRSSTTWLGRVGSRRLRGPDGPPRFKRPWASLSKRHGFGTSTCRERAPST
ncbi:MAG TPA: hypothetical protein VLB12_03180 [Gemmatimonadales bacterium]|nr:hypothetical protein [Gemmatimonadales bacterium]